MRARRSSPPAGSSQRRFATFGTALILAACLTLLKLMLVAFDMTENTPFAWPDTPNTLASADAPEVPGSLDDDKFVPWPAFVPEPAAGPEGQDEGPATPFGDAVPPPEDMTADEAASTFDPSTLTEGQITALQQLAARSRELDERERLLDMRSELNGRTEEKLEEQIDRLASLKERIEMLIDDLDEGEEQKLARLVKIYETMKPKAAAEIFNRLEIPVLLNVIERMKEAKSAVVLGRMNPAIAKRVTTELARRKERPSLDDENIGS